MKGNSMIQKYRIEVGNIVDHSCGDEVTAEDLEAVGGSADHLLKLGAISVVKPPTTKKDEVG